MKNKTTDAPQPHARILGDLIIIHAAGLTRRQIHRLAAACVSMVSAEFKACKSRSCTKTLNSTGG